MTRATVLLVMPDLVQAAHLGRTIEQRLGAHPAGVTTSEEALRWVAVQPCDACVLDYALADLDGLSTLVRLHQHRPDLPVVMVSESHLESTAIAAFHLGVADYVPKTPGYPEAVVGALQHVLTPEALGAPPAAVPERADVPEELLAPSYQNRLRAVGHQLDVDGYRSVQLAEVADGFQVRALPPGDARPQALQFGDRDFPQRIALAIGQRARTGPDHVSYAPQPTGYEDFLRAIGRWLDDQRAESISVMELDGLVLVAGMTRGHGGDVPEPFHQMMNADAVATLLAGAAARRSAPWPEPPDPPPPVRRAPSRRR
ncbi:MAG TPA: response regulator [Thermomicrobiaceae bacterium]|nr:response regulator [Thermomicrobiaceae bacterium]